MEMMWAKDNASWGSLFSSIWWYGQSGVGGAGEPAVPAGQEQEVVSTAFPLKGVGFSALACRTMKEETY
jgi:hypothetical protein